MMKSHYLILIIQILIAKEVYSDAEVLLNEQINTSDTKQKCEKPRIIADYFQDCKPPNDIYPANSVMCKCKHCPNAENYNLQLYCNQNKWYAGVPGMCDPQDPIYHCGNKYCTEQNLNNIKELKCEKISSFSDKKCRCRKNCVPVEVTCNPNEGWIYNKSLCDLNFMWEHYDPTQYLNISAKMGLFKYSCMDTLQLYGTESLKCKDGTLSGEEPYCGKMQIVKKLSLTSSASNIIILQISWIFWFLIRIL